MLWFWLFTLATDLLIPLLMIGFGRMFWKKAPREINSTFGYRTTMSMKNQDTWQFAHRYCGRLWYWLGLVMLPLTVVLMVFVLGREIGTIGWVGTVICFAQVVPMVGAIVPTEMALRRTFDKNGRRKAV